MDLKIIDYESNNENEMDIYSNKAIFVIPDNSNPETEETLESRIIPIPSHGFDKEVVGETINDKQIIFNWNIEHLSYKDVKESDITDYYLVGTDGTGVWVKNYHLYDPEEEEDKRGARYKTGVINFAKIFYEIPQKGGKKKIQSRRTSSKCRSKRTSPKRKSKRTSPKRRSKRTSPKRRSKRTSKRTSPKRRSKRTSKRTSPKRRSKRTSKRTTPKRRSKRRSKRTSPKRRSSTKQRGGGDLVAIIPHAAYKPVSPAVSPAVSPTPIAAFTNIIHTGTCTTIQPTDRECAKNGPWVDLPLSATIGINGLRNNMKSTTFIPLPTVILNDKLTTPKWLTIKNYFSDKNGSCKLDSISNIMSVNKRGISAGNFNLFHETSPTFCNLILQSNMFKRGKYGLVGGGIYLARSPCKANSKTTQNGSQLLVNVNLGRVLCIDNPSKAHVFINNSWELRNSIVFNDGFILGPIRYSKDITFNIIAHLGINTIILGPIMGGVISYSGSIKGIEFVTYDPSSIKSIQHYHHRPEQGITDHTKIVKMGHQRGPHPTGSTKCPTTTTGPQWD